MKNQGPGREGQAAHGLGLLLGRGGLAQGFLAAVLRGSNLMQVLGDTALWAKNLS